MKLYSTYSNSSIQLKKGNKIKDNLLQLFANNSIKVIVESGTYIGKGSTQMIINSYPKGETPEVFYTYEINYKFYTKAVKNLKNFPFVKPIWGLSIHPDEAKAYIKQDEAILNHEKYPDVYIDDIENPVAFYLNECDGYLSKDNSGILNKLFPITPKEGEEPEFNLLEKLLVKHNDGSPLIVLDSAGGTGYLEFITVEKTLQGKEFWILLDDIHHLKHFRSFEKIKTSSNYTIIDYDINEGWCLAKHL